MTSLWVDTVCSNDLAGISLKRFSFVESLCDVLILPLPFEMNSDDYEAAVLRSSIFLNEQVQRLPTLLRIATTLALIIFQIAAFASSLNFFQNLNRSRRFSILSVFCSPYAGPFAKLFRALRSLALFSFFEEPEVLALFNSKPLDREESLNSWSKER